MNEDDDAPAALALPPTGYVEWLGELKVRIRSAQLRASLAANSELVMLYWGIGRDILERQSRLGWGAKVIERLASDLRAEFPEMKGFSPRNLRYMRNFSEAWPESQIVQQVAAQLPWFHLCTLLDKLKTQPERDWYLNAAAVHNWSRAILVHQSETGAHARLGNAVTNFTARLPAPQSDLARESLKDPYRFDFLSLGAEALERDIESALMQHLTKFLLELGAGFAFVGRQVHLEVGGDDFYIDLLLYHLKLRSYVVIELKAGDFKPEHTGKLSFYLSAVDAQVKAPEDNPTIGLLLCKRQNRVVAEYAFRDVSKPIGVAGIPARSRPTSESRVKPTKHRTDRARTWGWCAQRGKLVGGKRYRQSTPSAQGAGEAPRSRAPKAKSEGRSARPLVAAVVGVTYVRG